MINHLKTFFIVSISSFFIILPAPNGFSQQDEEKYVLYTKEEIFQNIYKFEKLMNQKDDPTMAEYLELFDPETEEEVVQELYCFKKNYIPPINDKICNSYYTADKEDSKNVSLFFRLMRSSYGTFFKNSIPSKIEIYIYDNFKIDPNKDDLGIIIKFLVKTDKNEIKDCWLEAAKFRSHVNVFEKLNNIECTSSYIESNPNKESSIKK